MAKFNEFIVALAHIEAQTASHWRRFSSHINTGGSARAHNLDATSQGHSASQSVATRTNSYRWAFNHWLLPCCPISVNALTTTDWRTSTRGQIAQLQFLFCLTHAL